MSDKVTSPSVNKIGRKVMENKTCVESCSCMADGPSVASSKEVSRLSKQA